ncbi:PEP-CTERM motif protein [Opitutaceae bacterium TAV1]|nr:PEP-CTERM motif protein [Opitutaceae bacterium TAV1]
MKSFQFRTAIAFLALCASSSLFAQTLLVHYTFDEGSGSTTADSSGYGSATNGSLAGTASWTTDTPGGTGSALSITKGTGDANLVDAAATKVNTITDTFTISLWLNLQAAPTSGDRLVSTLTGNNGFDLSLLAPSSGTISASNFRLAVFVNTTGGNAVSANLNYSADDQWGFIAVTFDKGKVTFYTGNTDESVALLANSVNGTLPTSVTASTGSLQIGNTPATINNRTPTGYIDDVRIYSGVADATFLEHVRLSNVPEPATAAVLAGALVLVAAALAHRRRTR